MGKALALLLIIGMLLSACESNLWGSYDPYLTSTPGATGTVPVNPIATLTPTALTSMSSLPQIATDVATTVIQATNTPTPVQMTAVPGSTFFYTSQSGDSLNVVAIHFGIKPEDIHASVPLSATGFINPGTLLLLPAQPSQVPTTPSQQIIPDSELVDSPSAVGFDIDAYVNSAGGRLSTYTEWMNTVGTITGADGVKRISQDSSISPRLLLALIQSFTGWVQGQSKPGLNEKYVFGYINPANTTLYQQMRLVIQDLLTGYYGWRAGTLNELTFPDGSTLRIAPSLNAGSVALQYFFSKHLNYADWLQAIDPVNWFSAALQKYVWRSLGTCK